MIITQTPFRMSFFGGGTDFPDFYKEHGGAADSILVPSIKMVFPDLLPAYERDI